MADFYKAFASNLTPLLTRLFNSFCDTGALTPTMSMAEVVVIPKPGKDPLDCASYRPISLLNVDLKILTSILAACLGPYMQGLMDPDQSGFIPEHSCSDGTQRMCHLLDKIQRTQQPALLLSVDAEKAFARVHWPCLKQVLLDWDQRMILEVGGLYIQ